MATDFHRSIRPYVVAGEVAEDVGAVAQRFSARREGVLVERRRSVAVPFWTWISSQPVLAPDRESFPVDEGQEQGPEPFKEEVLGFRETFPDLRVEIDAVHVGDDGSVVAVRTTFTGTQEGGFLDIPATGEEVSFRAADVHGLSDDGERVADDLASRRPLRRLPAGSGGV